MLTFKQYLTESFLTEKRKNTHLNPRLSIIDQLKNVASKYGVDTVYCTFTSIPKLGANPRSDWNTPIGIYAYPLKYVIDKNLKVPFAGNQPNIVVFQIQPNANIWDLSNSNISSIKDKLLTAIQLQFPDADLTRDVRSPKELWHLMYSTIRENLPKTVDNIQRQGIISRKILTSIGLDGIIDPNDGGIIHPSEPTQGVFFNTSSIKQIDLINSSSLSPKWIFNNIARKHTSMLTDQDIDRVADLIKEFNDPEGSMYGYVAQDTIYTILKRLTNKPEDDLWILTAKIGNYMMNQHGANIELYMEPDEAETAKQFGFDLETYSKLTGN